MLKTGGALLRRALRRQRRRLAVSVLLLCLHQVSEAMVPVAIGIIIDRAVATGDLTALVWSLAGLGVLFTVLALAYRFGARFGFAAVEWEAYTNRVDIARTALDPRGRQTGLRDGEILTIAASDAELSALIVRATGITAAATTAVVVSAVALLTIHVQVGLAVLVGVPLTVFALNRLGPLLTRRSVAQQEAIGDTTALATDLVGGLRVLRGIGAQHTAALRYQAASRRALGVTLRAATTKGLHLGLTTAVNGILLAAVAAFAGWLALNGEMTVGQFVIVVGLAQFVAEPVQTLGWCIQLFATARASAGRVAGVLGSEPVVDVGTETPAPVTAVRLQLSAISYSSLNALSFAAKAGEILGVVAYDQRDAEALLALLSGRVPRYDGDLLVDGVPARDLADPRTVVHVEPHDVVLFEGTLRANLRAPDTPAEAVVGALRSAGAADLVESLDHDLTERGANLSGGQRQRVALARSYLTGHPVLVLHEPTSSVDPVTEAVIADALADARSDAGQATIVVTGSPTLLRRTTRVIVIDAGRVVADDTHDRLIQSDETYRTAVQR